MKDMEVVEALPSDECRGKRVKSRWVEGERTKSDGTMFVRSRLVAQEVNTFVREDVSAGTPPLLAVRLLISLCASQAGRRLLSLHDAEVAFFHASADEEMTIIPPKGAVPVGQLWQLKKALYGTRRAAKLWQEFLATVLVGAGWRRIICVPNCYHHDELGSTTIIHGDDLLSEGTAEALDRLDQVLAEKVRIKILGRIGPGAGTHGRFLKRHIEYVNGVFIYYGDEAHVWAAAAALGVQNGNGAVSPGTKATGESSRDSLEPLGWQPAATVASAGGCVMYAALDRPDIQFAAKTVMADASAPMNITEARLKRLVRYMMAAPRVEWHFPVQKLPTTVVGYSDSDWAGDRSTRRSTSGMIITFGAHPIDASSSTQACIALSSGEAELYAMGKAAASTILAAHLL